MSESLITTGIKIVRYSPSISPLFLKKSFGCSFAGCCGGISYKGIGHLHTSEGDVFPVQILEASVFLLIFGVSVLMYFRNRFDPIKAAIIFSFVKIMLDFLRASHADKIVSANQIMCMVVIVLLSIMLFPRTQIK